MVWGFCYLRIFKKMHSISGRSSTTNDENANAEPTTSSTLGRSKIYFNENHIYEIRKVIYKREHVTVDTLLQKLRDKHLFEHSRSRLHRLMLENGFKFKKKAIEKRCVNKNTW
jgi:hypothetical protein